MERKPGLTFRNPKPYPKTGERFVLRIEAYTDGIPGMFHDTADLMLWLSAMPYIHVVKLLEVGPELHNVKKDRTVVNVPVKRKSKQEEKMEGMRDEGRNQKEG